MCRNPALTGTAEHSLRGNRTWKIDSLSVRENLQELRVELRIHKAVLGLVTELVKRPAEFDVGGAKKQLVEIAWDFLDWPRQWNREKKLRGQSPLWRVPGHVIRRIAALQDPAALYCCLLRLTRES